MLSLVSEYVGKYSCTVESDPQSAHRYLIQSINHQTGKKSLFGQLSYRITSRENIYKIIIGQKSYDVKSSDLQHCYLTMIDPYNTDGSTRPKTLFQLNDIFSKSNETYHMNIHQKEWPLGYVAMTILLYLHERRRDTT